MAALVQYNSVLNPSEFYLDHTLVHYYSQVFFYVYVFNITYSSRL